MSKNLFNSIQLTKPKKNVFDLSHDVKFTAKFGQLIPCGILETVPGDKFNLSAEILARFQPMVAPVMHRFDLSVHYFFVPNRILWKGWEEFITGAKLARPGYVEKVLPFLNLNETYTNPALSTGKLANNLGIPQMASGKTVKVNALPFMAYQKIWWEYYRDQNVIDGDLPELSDGDNQANLWWLTSLQLRAWEHDYFTSALPWAQKSNVDVTIPGAIFKDVPVYVNNNPENTSGTFADAGSGFTGSTTNKTTTDPNIPGGFMYADTGGLESGATKINDLRRAFRLQEWLEKNARAGTRYVESILAHFGVKSSDARLQRPEYITGVKTPIQISEVLNTAGETGGLAQGNMAGHGIGAAGGYNGSFFCEEHGWIIAVASVLPKTSYFQGIHRKFTKFDRLDFFWPEFANIGEQAIMNKEIYANSDTPEGTFGYIPRYAEYKFENNRVNGEFQTNLLHWHSARNFTAQPTLSQSFIQCQHNNDIFAVADEDNEPILIDVLHKVKAVRPMPKYGTPMF